MSNQELRRVSSDNVSRTCLKLMLEYRSKLLLYGKGEILFHDEEGYDLVNKSLTDKRRKSFKNRDFQIKDKKGLSSKKKVSQIIDFDYPYFMMKDNSNSSILAVRDNNEALVISDILIPKDSKKRYLTREELEDYLTKDNQLIKYNGVWTNSLEVPTEEEILELFKSFVIKEYIDDQYDEEDKYILSSVVNNTTEEAITRGFTFMPEDFLVINGDKDMSINYVTVKYEGKDWFRVESKGIPLNKYNLSKVREMCSQSRTEEKLKFSFSAMKNIEIGKRFIKNI